MDEAETVSKCTWAADADPETSPHIKIDWKNEDKVHNCVTRLVGNTPIIKLNKIPESAGIQCEMYVKCEYMNPGGSEKDRFAVRAIQEAERTKTLKPGDTIIAPSLGNTAVSMALVAAIKGYPIKIVTPDDIIEYREITLNLLGADIIKVSKNTNPNSKTGLFGVCETLSCEIPHAVILNPYTSPDNPLCHYDGTAEEILDAFEGSVDMLVVNCRSGGIITGIGRKIREKCPNCIMVGINSVTSSEAEQAPTNDDKTSLDYSYSDSGSANPEFLPMMLDQSVIDKWIKSDKNEGFKMARRLIADEGIFCGVYSGMAVCVALNEAKTLSASNKCVIILPDNIRDYLQMFVNDSWLQVKNIEPCSNPGDYWWWDVNISELRLKPLQIAEDSMSCHSVMHIMRKYRIKQVPIINKHNSLVGAVTFSGIINKILSGEVHSKDPVGKCVTDYNGIEEGDSATLGLAMRTLELQPNAIIYQIASSEVGIIKKVTGLVKYIDILLYIQANDPKKV
ncbi:unnamed protein product [Brassicogethes aeneus]|uniref:CBS domain-containing protein n=1 Tax=Brassicogethes aeneus TaxID=1431903 RepID=A0A9P0FEZ1_BRAAE|nr:unnamed protein product [Brassicogethes aeneus]